VRFGFGIKGVLLGVIAGLTVAGVDVMAEPIVPDDTPWTVDDADPGSFPKSIEDLLARDRDADELSPPSQDQPGPAPAAPSSPRDRLGPPQLPGTIETARERLPETLRPVEPSAYPPPVAAVPAPSGPGLGEAPNAGMPEPEPAPAPIAQPAPAGPAQATPPVPEVTQPTIATNGKLYLPLQRYLDAKSATDLTRYAASDRAALSAHYEKTVGEPLWVTKAGYNDGAKSLIAELEKASEWGLSSTDYVIPQLQSASGDLDFTELTAAEVKLSLVALEYARHARGDRIDTPTVQLSSYIDRKPQIIEAPKVLAALLSAPDKGAYMRSLHPKHPQFELLRRKLAEVRTQRSGGTLPEPIPMGPKIMAGKEHAHVVLVRRLLGTPVPTSKADGSPPRETYLDEDLARAIADHKTRQQIEPVNTSITDALRRSLNARISLDENTILANMEQWRWMPEDLGSTYIWVNVPEFLVRVTKNGATLHEERVVTGRYETQTPIFSNKMRTVVFQPSWNVPDSIKVNELLPGLRSGRDSIAEQGLRVKRGSQLADATQIDWNRQDIRNYHIFQPPGPKNVLGVVKFLFPNKHAVYLHDTPSKRLFNEKIRTFSHGCMRVRDPVRLAEVIMAEDKGWHTASVQQLVADGPPDNEVPLERPIPVHVTYFTVWIGDDMAASVFPDIYGHEKRIKLALAGRWEEIETNPDHLAPADLNQVASVEEWSPPEIEPPRPVSRRRDVQAYVEQPLPEPRSTPTGYKQRQARAAKRKPGMGDFMSNIFGQN
jgi:murein L,D-transpeptidase YcbB/YkuD